LLAMSFLLLPVLPNRGRSVEDHQSSSDMTFAIITIMRWVLIAWISARDGLPNACHKALLQMRLE
jgi:hypothetical protein